MSNKLIKAIVLATTISISNITFSQMLPEFPPLPPEYEKARVEFYQDFPYALPVNVRIVDEILEGFYVIGLCLPESNLILISDKAVKNAKAEVKFVVYHELGHCALSLAHWEKGLDFIMSPSGRVIADWPQAIKDFSQYHKETCQGRAQSFSESFQGIPKGNWIPHLSCENRTAMGRMVDDYEAMKPHKSKE